MLIYLTICYILLLVEIDNNVLHLYTNIILDIKL